MSIVYKTDVFLTHDWGEDELKRSNHERVSRVNKALQQKGLRTWFDEERMNGNIRDKMAEGIEETKIVVAFITEKYRNKVNSNNAIDNCYFEFNYATLEKTGNFMIPVVMEPRMRNPRDWKGRLGAELGTHLYVDLSEDNPETFEKKVEELFQLIKQTIAAYEETVKANALPATSRRGSQSADQPNDSPAKESSSIAPASGSGDTSKLASNAKAVLSTSPLSSLSPRVNPSTGPAASSATSGQLKPSIGAKTALNSLSTLHPATSSAAPSSTAAAAASAATVTPSSGGLDGKKFSFASSLLKSINDNNNSGGHSNNKPLPPFTEFAVHHAPPTSTTTAQSQQIHSSIYTGGSASLRLHQPPDQPAPVDPLSSSLPKKFSFADSLTQSLGNNSKKPTEASHHSTSGGDGSKKTCPWCYGKNELSARSCLVCHQPLDTNRLPADLVQESLALNHHTPAPQGQGQTQGGSVQIKLTTHPLGSLPENGKSPRISPRLSLQTGAMIIQQLQGSSGKVQQQHQHQHQEHPAGEKVCPWCQAKNSQTARHCTKCQSRF
jgi:ribosomal protein L40E